MLEIIIISIFCAFLIGGVVLHISLVLSLLAGLGLFWIYGLMKHIPFKSLLKMTVKSSLKAKNIIIILSLIGAMTGLWRACGTIAYIVTVSAKLFRPSIALLMIFLLNSAVSFLIGTSFGTAASMGTICMTIANLLGISPVFSGGAVLAGCFFGDRCSPLSSSASLVASVTDTDLYQNIKNMFRSAFVPTVASIILYTVIGVVTMKTTQNAGMNTGALVSFSENFTLSVICVIPAVLVLVLALFKTDVKINLLCSIVLSFFIGLYIQGLSVKTLLSTCLNGYHPNVADAGKAVQMLAGGGFTSMINVLLIVIIASSYAGVFEGTGMTDGLSNMIARLSKSITPFGSILVVSIISCAMACNQSLPILLVEQLCRESEPDKYKLALAIEDTVIVVAPLIPWSIAVTIPLATIGAPASAVFAAFFLYLLPIYRLVTEIFNCSV